MSAQLCNSCLPVMQEKENTEGKTLPSLIQLTVDFHQMFNKQQING